jgi:hypothetical protein
VVPEDVFLSLGSSFCSCLSVYRSFSVALSRCFVLSPNSGQRAGCEKRPYCFRAFCSSKIGFQNCDVILLFALKVSSILGNIRRVVLDQEPAEQSVCVSLLASTCASLRLAQERASRR